jgi:hypothetical protein
MEPVFTIPYSEYAVANRLSALFPAKDGFSILIPASRQEKGIDLVLARRSPSGLRAVTLQVKSSRTYSPKPTKGIVAKKFRFNTWFNRFDVPDEADYVFLVGLYPPEEGRSRRRRPTWWSEMILVFTHDEMASFLGGVKTLSGKPDRMFGFGFDEPFEVVQSRGDEKRRLKDFSAHLLENKADQLHRMLVRS